MVIIRKHGLEEEKEIRVELQKLTDEALEVGFGDNRKKQNRIFTKSILQMKADDDFNEMLKYKDELASQHKAKSTQDTYIHSFTAFEAFRIKEKIHHLELKETIQSFLNLPIIRDKTNSAKNNYIAAVNFYIKHVSNKGEKSIPMLTVQKRKEIATIEGEDLKKVSLFREKFKDHKYMIAFDIGIEFGLRRAEIVALKTSDIKKSRLPNGKEIMTIEVRHGKGNKQRTASSFYAETDIMMENYKDGLKDKTYVLLDNNFDDMPQKKQALIQKAVGRNLLNFIKNSIPTIWHDKKNITMHGLRHSIASRLYSDNLSINDIKTLLGHENEAVTKRYLSKEAVNKNHLIQIQSGRGIIDDKKKELVSNTVDLEVIEELVTIKKTTTSQRCRKRSKKKGRFK